MITLRYKERSFIKKAKQVLRQGESLCVSFDGSHARLISHVVPLLMDMKKETKKEENKSTKISNAELLIDYLILIFRLSPFMVIFWLGVANRNEIEILTNSNELVEIIFR